MTNTTTPIYKLIKVLYPTDAPNCDACLYFDDKVRKGIFKLEDIDPSSSTYGHAVFVCERELEEMKRLGELEAK